MPNIVMEVANRDGPVLMPLPPDREQLANRLAAYVALLGFAHPVSRVLAAEREQRITHPPTPLLEAPERAAWHDTLRDPTPAPDRQQRRQQFRPPFRDLGADVGGERPRLRIFRSRVKFDSDEATGQVLRDRQAVPRQDHQGGSI
jgi:hypothetical protein